MPLTISAGQPVVFAFDFVNPPSLTAAGQPYLGGDWALLKCGNVGGGLLGSEPVPSGGEEKSAGRSRAAGNCLAGTLFCIGATVRLRSLKSSLSHFEGSEAQIVYILTTQEVEVSVGVQVFLVRQDNLDLVQRAVERRIDSGSAVFSSLVPTTPGAYRLAFSPHDIASTSRSLDECANGTVFAPEALLTEVFTVIPAQLAVAPFGASDKDGGGARFVAAQGLPRINVTILDLDGHALRHELGAQHASTPVHVSVALYQANGSQVLSNLEGSVTVPVVGGNASFTDLAVVGIAGRNFSLRFYVESEGLVVDVFSAPFDVVPASLYVPYDAPSRQTLTVGDQLTVAIGMLDARQTTIEVWSTRDFEIGVAMEVRGKDISQHLVVEASSIYNLSTHPSERVLACGARIRAGDSRDGGMMAEALYRCVSRMVLSVHAIASDVRLHFYTRRADTANATTAAFHVLPRSMQITGDAIANVSVRTIGLPLGHVVVQLSQWDQSVFQVLDEMAVEARLASCLHPASDLKQVQKYLGGTVSAPVMHSDGTSVFTDLTVNVAGDMRLVFQLSVGRFRAPITASSTGFTVHPLLKLLAIGDDSAASPTEANLSLPLDVYGFVRIPAISVKAIPENTETVTPFAIQGAIAAGARFRSLKPVLAPASSRPVVFTDLEVDPQGSSSFILTLSVAGNLQR